MSSPLNFPLNPSPGQVYTAGDGSWAWDGTKWDSGYSAKMYLPLIGGSLANPGNLAVGGTLNVAGSTTLGVLTAGSSTLAGLNVTGATALAAATGITMATADSSLNLATTAFIKNQGYATTSYVSGNYLPLSGGTSGGVTLSGGNISGAGSVTFSGNVIGNNSVQSNGVYFQNNSGWFYTPQNFFAGGAVGVSGNTGFYWQYNGGWMYSPNSVQAGGNIQANAGLITNNGYVTFNALGQTLYPPGDGWLYFNGSFRSNDFQTNNNVNANGWVSAGGRVYAGGTGGVSFYNNGGYFQVDNAFECANVVFSYNNQVRMQNLGILYANYCGSQFSFLMSGGYVYIYVDNGQAGWVTFNGCDARQKKNFGPVERDCLEAINAIELQSFDWPQTIPSRRTVRRGPRPEDLVFEEEPLNNPHWKAGYTAQQVREVIPEAVPDPPTENGFMGVDLQMLVAHLVGAVQQLTRRLEAVEGK